MSKFDLSNIPKVYHNGVDTPRIYMNGVLVWESNAKTIDYVYRSPEYVTSGMEVFLVFENTSDGTFWAITHDTVTVGLPAPLARQLPISDIQEGSILLNSTENIRWIVEYIGINESGGAIVKFRKKDSETEYLYTLDTANGVRIGEGENNEFDYTDYLQNIATGRFLCCFNNKDIRARRSNDSYVEQSGRFYVLEIGEQE